jgi:VWFA-related protein
MAVAAGSVVLSAQKSSDPAENGVTFRAETALMEVEIRVTQKGGRPVTGLTKNDFTLSENGEPQTIATVEYVAEPTEEAAIRLPNASTQTEESEQLQSDARSTPRATRVLIISHVGPGEVKRVRKAVRKFIEENLSPGVLISLDGAPFTDHKQLLLDLLAGRIKAAELPGRPFRADVQAGTDFSEQDQLEQQEKGFGSMKEGFSNIIQDQEGRSHLFRYVDIARGLGKYPGKKTLVLFSRGLALGYSRYQGALTDRGVMTDRGMFVNLDNTGLMRRLRAETMRARIQFYVVDARGLDALDRTATAAHSNLGIEARFGSATPSGAQLGVLKQQMLMLAPTAGLGEDSYLSRQGLRMLAEQTGGKAVLNTNDLGHVFELVKEDLHGYYLLGYYPPEREDDGFRKLKIDVQQKGLKLTYRKGYYGQSLEKFVEVQDRAAATSANTENVPKAAVKAYREALTAIQAQPAGLEKALEQLYYATEVHPSFALAWNVAGYAESVRGNEDEAKAALNRAITVDASYESPRRHLMVLLNRAQDWAGTETAANGLLALRPEDAEAYYYLAVAQFNQRNDGAALATTRAALQAGPADEYPPLLRIHGDLLAAAGDTVGAAEAYRQFLEAEPDSPLADTLRQRIERGERDVALREIHADVQAGNWAVVVERSNAVLGDHPDWTAVKIFLALGRFNLGQQAEAEKLAREVTSIGAAERFPEAHYVLGLALAEQGKVEAAIEEYRRFLMLQPASPLASEVRETLVDWELLIEPD